MAEKAIPSLKNLLVPSKETTLDFPGLEGFKVSLKYLTRDALIKMREKATKQKYRGRSTEEEMDQEHFLHLYSEAAITNWQGLKLRYLSELAPVELGDHDPEDFLAYSTENAYFLMRNSTDFDSWISKTVGDLSNFSEQQWQQVSIDIDAYFRNSRQGMTKSQYLDLCEQLGTEPLASEMPLDFDDLPYQVQTAFKIYGYMQDNWDYMGGNYIGKNINDYYGLADIYDIPKIDRLYYLELIMKIDNVRKKVIEESKPTKQGLL